MAAANPQRKTSRPAYSPPRPACRSADVIAFDFARKKRIAFYYDGANHITQIADLVAGPVYTDATLGTIRPVTTFTYDSLSNRTQVQAGYTTDTSGTGTAADGLTMSRPPVRQAILNSRAPDFFCF